MQIWGNPKTPLKTLYVRMLNLNTLYRLCVGPIWVRCSLAKECTLECPGTRPRDPRRRHACMRHPLTPRMHRYATLALSHHHLHRKHTCIMQHARVRRGPTGLILPRIDAGLPLFRSPITMLAAFIPVTRALLETVAKQPLRFWQSNGSEFNTEQRLVSLIES